jgi:hypothetical protein
MLAILLANGPRWVKSGRTAARGGFTAYFFVSCLRRSSRERPNGVPEPPPHYRHGEQDVERWAPVGPKLKMRTWVEITNDRRTWWVLARVETIAGGRDLGLKGLSLRFIVPPQISDRDGGQETATGSWHFRYSGPFKRFEIVAPNGQVRLDGINTESAARLRCAEMERIAGVFRR